MVAAASPEVDQALRKGQFREDFYYRLCSDRLALPPLRERLCESSRELPRLVSGLFRKMTGTQDKALLASVLRQIEPMPSMVGLATFENWNRPFARC